MAVAAAPKILPPFVGWAAPKGDVGDVAAAALPNADAVEVTTGDWPNGEAFAGAPNTDWSGFGMEPNTLADDVFVGAAGAADDDIPNPPNAFVGAFEVAFALPPKILAGVEVTAESKPPKADVLLAGGDPNEDMENMLSENDWN